MSDKEKCGIRIRQELWLSE